MTDEIERHLRRQSTTSGGVLVAQNSDRAQKRLRCWRAFELEGGQEGRRPSPDRGVLGVQFVQGIDVFGWRQCGGLGDSLHEPFPGDLLLDRRERVGSVFFGGDQCRADPGIKADLLDDGAALAEEGVGMAALGPTKQAAEKPAENVEGEIGQSLTKLERDGGEHGQTALGHRFRQMLHRGPAAFARKLAETVLVDSMAAFRGKAQASDVRQPVEHRKHRRTVGPRGGLQQPGKPGKPRLGLGFQQGFEVQALMRGQSLDKRAMDLLTGLMPDLSAQPLDRRRRRQHDVPPTQLFQHGAHQGNWAVGHERGRQQPCRHILFPASRVDAAMEQQLELGSMPPPGLVVTQVFFERLREDADLFGDEPDERDRWTLTFPQQPSRMAQGAKHQGKAKAGVVMPLPGNQHEVPLGQRVVPDQIALDGRVIEKSGALRGCQQRTGHGVSVSGRSRAQVVARSRPPIDHFPAGAAPSGNSGRIAGMRTE